MLDAILKYLLQFLNEYGELDTVKTGYQLESFLGAKGEALGQGVVESNFILNCNFGFFLGVWWRWRWHENFNFSMNMVIWVLSIQGIGRKPLVKHWKNLRVQGDSEK